jgi:hypothetical protein
MKRVRIIFFGVGLVLVGFLSSCQKIDRQEHMINQAKIDIGILAADSLEGRETGTEGEKMAAEYIKSRFVDIGLLPKGDNGTYFQDFSHTPRLNPHKTGPDEDKEVEPIHGRNVIGYIDNQAEFTVVIGAHYDHLGWGGMGSLNNSDPAIHNGADDNASGVASLLLLAQELKSRNTNNNYLFIAFSGEEKGLWGSNYFTKNATIPLEEINYMFNMDMVGRLDDENSLALHGVGTSPNWSDDLDEIGIDSLKLVKSESGIGNSDQTSFYLKDIPVIHFFTGAHEDYHKPTDDAEKLNYEGLIVVTAYIDSLITRLDDDGELEFTKTKDENTMKSPKFTVTLGVIPDYMFDGVGMRIDGVREDRPAYNAGMEDGDIVIKMGDQEVTDMMSYMEGLSKFKEGDKTIVIAKRGDKELTFEVQF